ncbi:MAG: ABC transporter permease subunit [Flavobacteriales bacterium]|nr:ABC transporter permease subunit [Flavobacteriales bacterium]
MLRLFKIEFRKLKTNRSFYIFTSFYLISLVGLAWTMGSFNLNFNQAEVNLGNIGIFDFPNIWQNITYVASFFKIILAIIFITFITNEYQYRTLRQNLIDGLSKKEFLASKVIMMVSMAALSTLFVLAIILIIGFTQSSYLEMDIIFMKSSFIFAYFIKLVAFFSMIMLIAFVVKKTGFSLATLFIWAVIIEPLLTYKFLPEGWSRALPLEAMSNLIHEPFSRITNADKLIGNITYSSVDPIDVAISLAYTTLFIFLSYQVLKKNDL